MRLGVALAAVGGVLVLAYGVPALALAGDVPPGTKVGGVDIGGIPPSEARVRLEAAFAKAAASPLTVLAAGATARLEPADLGLSFDADASIAQAMDGAATPAGLARSLFGTRLLTPRVKVDTARLEAAMAELAKKIDKRPREGGIHYRGLEPQTVLPKAGRALDRDGAVRAIRAAFLTEQDSIKLPVTSVPPAVPAAEIRRVAGTTAKEAVAAPLTLKAGSATTTLPRLRLSAGLRFVSDGKGALQPSFDPADVVADLEKELVGAAQRPQEATVKLVKGKPKVVPGKAGRGLDRGALGEAVSGAVAGASRTVEVPVTEVQPKLTTEKAAKLGVKEKVSSFTTNYPCCAPRVTNIHTIADIVDGHLVKPGETFSLNGLVGKRDKARGFVEAPMILNGRFVDDVGGGVSQFATTMFNAVFFGGFQDVQHSPHQFFISRYPAGRESTVSFPQPDFRWRNDSPYGVLIKTRYTATSVTVEFWSTKRFDIESESSPRYNVKSITTATDSGPDCIPMGGVEGFEIDVWRIFRKGGEVVRKQKFHTVYDVEPRLTCEE